MAVNENQDFFTAFEEISAIIEANIPEIKHVDLWANQTDSPEDEYPFPVPALFISAQAVPEEIGSLVQTMETDIKMYLLFIPYDDTHVGERKSLREFAAILRKIQATFHGRAGDNFSQMGRIGWSTERAPAYEWLHSQTFRCQIMDYAAYPQYEEEQAGEMSISKGTKPFVEDNTYNVPEN